jgi:hypothetical protein
MRRSISLALLLSTLAACNKADAPASRDEAAPATPAASAAAYGDGGGAKPKQGLVRGDEDKDEGADSPGLAAPAAPGERSGRASEESPSSYRSRPEAGPVRAGEWDDNANYREFMRYLESESALSFHKMDLRNRRFLVVRDVEGRGVPNCSVAVSDGQKQVALTTAASGRAILFPRAEGLVGTQLTATTHCGEGEAEKSFSLSDDDGVVDLQLGTSRGGMQKVDVDLAFILDTTGSMSEEIQAVKSTIDKVARELSTREVRVRVALVEYKDRSDDMLTKVYPFTSDLASFRSSVAGINASGGGDMPEDAVAGLHAGLTELSWSDSAVARVAFVIGDAPPHLDYQSGTAYENDMRAAARRGIKIHTVAASGMDALGQAVWRQVAQYTGGSNLFVLRGGAGPQSTGGGDPKSSCGGVQESYASGNLDQLITAKVSAELASLERDPMRIAGLGQDENAKPCDQRVTFKQ